MFSKPYLLKFDAFQKSEFAADWQKFGTRIPALPIFSASIAPLKEASEKHLALNKDFFLSHANSIYGNFGRFSRDTVAIGVKPVRGIDSGLEVQKVEIGLAKHIIEYYSAQ